MTIQDLVNLRGELDVLVGSHKRAAFFRALFEASASRVQLFYTSNASEAERVAERLETLGLDVQTERSELYPGHHITWVSL